MKKTRAKSAVENDDDAGLVRQGRVELTSKEIFMTTVNSPDL